jgi:fumarylacetoacetate (FAA) hydrolase family protein
MLVKHIRQTSSIASSVGMNDVIRVQKLAKVVKAAPEVHLKVMSSGKIKG